VESTIFCDITPCSPLRINQRFGGKYRLHLQGRKISQARNQHESRCQACHLLACWFAEPISSTLNMEAICSSETLVETQRTTWRHIPDDDTLHYILNLTNFSSSVIQDRSVEPKSSSLKPVTDQWLASGWMTWVWFLAWAGIVTSWASFVPNAYQGKGG
jgi:hypothetical protein